MSVLSGKAEDMCSSGAFQLLNPKRTSRVKNYFRVQLPLGSLWADPGARRQSRQFRR
jgi:hypothetical protein